MNILYLMSPNPDTEELRIGDLSKSHGRGNGRRQLGADNYDSCATLSNLSCSFQDQHIIQEDSQSIHRGAAHGGLEQKPWKRQWASTAMTLAQSHLHCHVQQTEEGRRCTESTYIHYQMNAFLTCKVFVARILNDIVEHVLQPSTTLYHNSIYLLPHTTE